MGYLAAQSAILAIGLVTGLICSAVGLFFGHIILFDSIALGIAAGVCCNAFTTIHPALFLVIGIAVTSLLSLGYSILELTCLPAALKNVDITGFLLVFLCQRS